MIMTRWMYVLAVTLVAMGLVCLVAMAVARGCDVPADDDDSATTEDVFEELDQEFSDPDESYQPGVL